ncbi:MAG: hypothetical protein KatS3mg047_1439 [Bellilinea sp.]|nr:MAG: hypothetical protein KatS3mg047_1439 [Bellilinea sp.]
MSLFSKPAGNLTEGDLVDLITNQVSEGKRIEYKSTLPNSTEESKKEFLADVSSFANTQGGFLIFGIDEENGYPKELSGIEVDDPDAEKLRLEDMIRNGIEPRIPMISISAIRLENQHYVFVIYIPQSFLLPHMVTFRNLSRFYARNSAGKYQMDVQELRQSFLLSETIEKKIHNFRLDRVARIAADQTPVKLVDGPRYVIHVIPYPSFFTKLPYDIREYRDISNKWLQPTTTFRYNLDGYVRYLPGNEGVFERYYQFFKGGYLEITLTNFVRQVKDRFFVNSRDLEREIILTVKSALQFLNECNFEAPLFVFLSLIGVKGLPLLNSNIPQLDYIDFTHEFDRDPILLPELYLESYPDDYQNLPALLKPLIDTMWNAAGMEGSPYTRSNIS